MIAKIQFLLLIPVTSGFYLNYDESKPELVKNVIKENAGSKGRGILHQIFLRVLRISASGFGWSMTHFNNDLYVGAPLTDQAKGAVYQCENLQNSPNCDEKVLH